MGNLDNLKFCTSPLIGDAESLAFCSLDPVLENCLRPPPIPSLHLYIASCSPQQARQIGNRSLPRTPLSFLAFLCFHPATFT